MTVIGLLPVMNKRLDILASRRLELLETIEAQRMDVARISQHLEKPLAVADVAVNAVRLIYDHPAWFAGAMTALLTWRRKGLAGMAKNGWRLLYLYPSAIFFGMKYLSSKIHPPGKKSSTEV
jgi:hypothetical protein